MDILVFISYIAKTRKKKIDEKGHFKKKKNIKVQKICLENSFGKAFSHNTITICTTTFKVFDVQTF